MDRGTCQKGEIFVVHHHHHRRVLPEVSNTSHMTLATVTGAVVDIVEAVKDCLAVHFTVPAAV
ncbi:hypothetical protein AT3G44405 [Arabidopsis thaliana]|uniref:Uncharacterized protein n=1 Tax=Arabidopsis thaliana TaxID=3702 RepID=A0A1I9LPM5_ARATH|nr:uncharacterized protein AT3G44405 [Arabidopsis thaliana]NP_001326553.1 uncharacterized protein AT3G44405 [Arabidopsis thaliana]NP_001326554.1 uncharacterized protein AT3G44405 [Arabidopsis thaliana]ANM64532.1 hypothetical protein AT3G44405 [Arabidopsis thaliana]ANM64533.1 hypothetical protein AT3G44405 [Arabidopsis thaliana]ANM64534.1 hypothetical protein AT3G44405 [Arabidopsis thaliana]|eukprot:NP_001326552.1 hypothetical protein AT3G44405 [Arabidopsis thaliana]